MAGPRDEAIQRDWISDAAEAYDQGDLEKARTAAQIEIASMLAIIGTGWGENLDGIGNALGDLIAAVNRRA